MKKQYLYLLCFVLMHFATSCITINKSTVEKNYTNCNQIIEGNSKNWIKDNAGNCSLRSEIFNKMEEMKCSFANQNWKNLEKHLGKANKEIIQTVENKQVTVKNYIVCNIIKKQTESNKKFEEQKILSFWVDGNNNIITTKIISNYNPLK